MKLEKIDFSAFHEFYSSLNIPEKYDEEFLYELFNAMIDSYNENVLKHLKNSTFGNLSTTKLFLYMIAEYDYFACKLSREEIANLNDNENLLSGIISMALDKYLTNEKVDLNEIFYVSKYSSNISTLMLYLNFMNKIMLNYSQNRPDKSLLSDVLMKCIRISKCSLDLLVDGFEAEAFSVWRTLHETECVLRLLVIYKEPLIKEYLVHMNYSLAYRKGITSSELTDRIFVEIKDKLRARGLKSKDMKKFIEYGYLFAIPNIELDKDFKLNFRDGVEKLAGLSEYSKIYEFSSEIAHSSPLMIYSNEKTLAHLTLVSLYEVFFRIEVVFTSHYLNAVTDDLMKKSYLTMRNLYYSQLKELYNREKEKYQKLISKE